MGKTTSQPALDEPLEPEDVLKDYIAELVFLEQIGLSPRGWRRYLAKGDCPAGRFPIGRAYYYPRASVAQWLAERPQKFSKPGRRPGT